MLNKGNVIKTGEITGIFSARIISNILGSILITRHAERSPSPDPDLGKRFFAGKLQIFDIPSDQGSKRFTKYLANGIIRYTSSETEGLTTEMSTAMKAMPGTRRD